VEVPYSQPQTATAHKQFTVTTDFECRLINFYGWPSLNNLSADHAETPLPTILVLSHIDLLLQKHVYCAVA
jgi:hypothetical protein